MRHSACLSTWEAESIRLEPYSLRICSGLTGFEVGFGTGEEGALPAIPIPNGKINALLRGYVDRVDVWKSPGSEYYRVVDYKTGKKDFDYCDVFNGVGLQMLLYLFALKKSGSSLLDEHSIPAGVQYFPARVRYISTDGVPEPEQIEEMIKNGSQN